MPERPERMTSGVLEDAVVLGDNGSYSPEPKPLSLPPEQETTLLVEEVGTVFSLQGFEHPRTPLIIGEGVPSGIPVGTRLSSLPLKFPYGKYRIPNELSSIRNILERCISFEHTINPDIRDYYAYLTLHRTEVSLGDVQRGAVIHSDGIQGPRIQPKEPIERGYSLVDRFPPRFFIQAFDMSGVDADLHILDPVFESQADATRSVVFPTKAIVLFDTYCVHQALPATEEGSRTFLRLAYSTRQYDRLGNSVNKLFEEEYEEQGWNFQPRPLPSNLVDPPIFIDRG